ncbi:LPS export ABC transporter permease LptG [Geobacter sp. AOG1]|uniref:LPS export ABC transporter permease LptG n=1 Tax=Geobacter sp. AOG1 TaxID=1566346 RepID=UPI001CC82040|nr:LPS export ABC transporter permease LptG [Geobacter sp. AOG1]GFE59349.1 LPS export ABC transporter permease LptG [Geobacter sp. AOG1]
MRILSRYITALYLRMICLCGGSFIAVYLIIDFLEKITRLARYNPELKHLALFFAAKIPEMINQVAPLAILMATMLTLGILAKNSEIIAMRSCGVGLVRISIPLLATALLISLAVLLNGELIVPRANARLEQIENILIKKKSADTFFRQSNIWHKEENSLLQARLFSPATRTLQGITFWQLAPDMRPVRRIDAGTGSLVGDGWLFKDVTIRDFSAGNVTATRAVAELPVQLQLKPADLKVLEMYADNMGFIALRRYCEKLQNGGYDATRYLTQMHSRLSLPFSALVMAFIGIPFALKSGRSSGIAVGIGLSILIGFSFFVINSALISFGQGGALPPLIAAWAANAIFAAMGVWLTLTVNR